MLSKSIYYLIAGQGIPRFQQKKKIPFHMHGLCLSIFTVLKSLMYGRLAP